MAEAYHSVMCHIGQWQSHGGNITVITGRSGQIAQEFPSWLHNRREIARVEPLNGGGAFRVTFRKINNK